MEKVQTNSILSNKIQEIKELVEKLNLDEGIEQLNIHYWQIESLAAQTKEYIENLNNNMQEIMEDFTE